MRQNLKMFLYIILVSFFILTIISCAEKEESTATTDTPSSTSEDDSSDDASSLVVTMASLTIGSQTYTNAFQSVTDGCQDTELTDNSNGDKIYYLTTIVYYDNKTLSQSAPFYKDSSCTNKYTETSVVTNEGTFANPFTFGAADNITVVQLSNYFDNGTAMPVFDNDSNAVDNGSMYGLIGNSDNVSKGGPLAMWGQIYPKSDNEVHASFGRWYACDFTTETDNCTSPDNFTHIQDNVAGSFTLRLEKYTVLK